MKIPEWLTSLASDDIKKDAPPKAENKPKVESKKKEEAGKKKEAPKKKKEAPPLDEFSEETRKETALYKSAFDIEKYEKLHADRDNLDDEKKEALAQCDELLSVVTEVVNKLSGDSSLQKEARPKTPPSFAKVLDPKKPGKNVLPPKIKEPETSKWKEIRFNKRTGTWQVVITTRHVRNFLSENEAIDFTKKASLEVKAEGHCDGEACSHSRSCQCPCPNCKQSIEKPGIEKDAAGWKDVALGVGLATAPMAAPQPGEAAEISQPDTPSGVERPMDEEELRRDEARGLPERYRVEDEKKRGRVAEHHGLPDPSTLRPRFDWKDEMEEGYLTQKWYSSGEPVYDDSELGRYKVEKTKLRPVMDNEVGSERLAAAQKLYNRYTEAYKKLNGKEAPDERVYTFRFKKGMSALLDIIVRLDEPDFQAFEKKVGALEQKIKTMPPYELERRQRENK